MQRRRFIAALSASGTAALGGLPARAQAFPVRPLRYIVPVAAGGGSDLVGRTVTERWGRLLGQGFVVDNIGGGGGAIACLAAAKSAPDGYTLLQGYVGTHGTNPATRSKLPYDAVKDFTAVGMIGATPNVLVIHASLAVQSVAQFVEYMRRNPGRVSYGSAGQGTLTHLTMELFKQAANAFALHIPYRGIAPAFNDLLGGQTQAMFPGLAAALPHLRSGRVRALAVTGAARHPLLKDVPTLIEFGYKGFDAVQWYGVVGPAGMAPAVVKTLNDTLNTVLTGSDLRDRLSSEAIEPQAMTPEAFGQFIRDDIARWTRLAHDHKIDLDS
ncbi:MAG: tripartite tricarboxylate transporter substrate binding protein [Betaproteobacteria bacterium]|nr:tripartite tricarboxylate transporter substrate binding protein [Betaproteobacteria bacterium]